MRQGRALVMGLLTGLLVGCASHKPVRAISWLDRWRPFHGPSAADVVQVDVFLLERPLGDSFIDQELWTLADEQIVPLERKAVLEENGFRVGELGGSTPAGLLTLLTSERSCVNPRRLFLHAGNATPVVLGPTAPLCRFQMPHDGEPIVVSLEQAQCTFKMVPGLTSDGRTRLEFTPEIRHGEKTLAPQAAADGSGFILQEERPTKSYHSLAWEVTLAPNQYVVVGARSDRPETLGYQFFLRRAESVPVQRLLVMRTCRMAGQLPSELTADSSEDDVSMSRTPPLALQAAWTKARGSAP